MRTVILVVATLVVALVSGVLLVAPHGSPARVTTTEQIRTSHGHHHKTIASWATDDSDDDGDDDDDDVAQSPIVCPLTPIDDTGSHATPPVVVFEHATLGPAAAHTQTVERPPRV